MQSFDTGNVRGVAEHLKRCGYYQADVEHYVTGLTLWYNHALKVVMPKEERERKEKEQADFELADYERRFPFTPECACTIRI
jgi:hypothetical protein